MKKAHKGSQKRKEVPPTKNARQPATRPAGKSWAVYAGIAGLVIAVAALLAGIISGKSRRSHDSQASAPRVGGLARAGSSNRVSTVATRTAQPATPQDRDSAAASLNAKANEQLKAGDIEAAISSYREALALTPGDEDFHLNLGLAYVRRGDVTNAETQFREALRLVPDYPEAHNSLGNLYLRSGKLTEAEQEFTEAIRQMPEYAQAHNNLGIVFQRQNRIQEALASFQKATEYETNYWQAHFNLAGAYFQQKNLEKGIAELRETLRINPGFEPAQQLLAQASNATSVSPRTNP